MSFSRQGKIIRSDFMFTIDKKSCREGIMAISYILLKFLRKISFDIRFYQLLNISYICILRKSYFICGRCILH